MSCVSSLRRSHTSSTLDCVRTPTPSATHTYIDIRPYRSGAAASPASHQADTQISHTYFSQELFGARGAAVGAATAATAASASSATAAVTGLRVREWPLLGPELQPRVVHGASQM